MSRKDFIQKHGATCDNWNWSWSFVNDQEKFVIFGAWDKHTEGRRQMIFDKKWEFKNHSSGRKNAGFNQSLRHIRLVESGAYRLFTFPMQYGLATTNEPDSRKTKIRGFTPKLTEKTLLRVNQQWFAADLDSSSHIEPLAEELPAQATYTEGAKVVVTLNKHERDANARRACINHYGTQCIVCGFDFKITFGDLGDGFIHVHHLVPIASIGKAYQIDPIKDLSPVCPNCHAMLHRTNPPLLVEDLKKHIRKTRDSLGNQ